MAQFRIAVIPGDGIGNEVVPEGIKVLERIAETSGGQISFVFESFPWGSAYYHQHGRMMAENALSVLQRFDAIYFGAVGWPDVPDHVSLWGLRLAICQGFDQYVCLRPVRLLPGIASPLRDGTPERIDFVVVRENTEGEYAGVGGRRGSGDSEIALQTAVFTAHGCERIIRYAFDLAMTRHETKGHERDQEQCPAVRHDALGRGLPPGRGRISTGDDRAMARRCHGRPVRAQARDARCRGRLEPLRRHPVRSWQRARGQSRHRGQRQYRSGAPHAEHVRAGAWVSAGHCRPGHRKPDRPDLERRPDARSPRAYRTRRGGSSRPSNTRPRNGITTPDLGGNCTTAEAGTAIVNALG